MGSMLPYTIYSSTMDPSWVMEIHEHAIACTKRETCGRIRKVAMVLCFFQ